MADQFEQAKNEDFPHHAEQGTDSENGGSWTRERDPKVLARKAKETFSGMVAGMDSDLVVKGLGWFSVGLGMMEMIAPQALSRMIKVGYRPVWMRACGVREMIAGVGILTSPKQPAGWLWGRVIGDAEDLAALGWAMDTKRRGTAQRAMAVAAVCGVTALDVMSALGYTKMAVANGAEASVTIGKSPQELYDLWREPKVMSQIMGGFAEVKKIDEEHMHWVIPAVMGKNWEFDAKSIDQRPGELIRWKSINGSVPPHGGEVWFRPAPGERGTEVTMRFKIEGSANMLHQAAFTIMPAVTKMALRKTLMRFKSLAETGEIPTVKNNPSARNAA